MSDLNVKTWVRTPDIYGQPLSIDELDYANGLFLAHCEHHPNESDPFGTVIVSNDLSHWQHRPSSPSRDYKMKNVRITGFKDKFVVLATAMKDDGKHLITLTSENGFDWNDGYISEDASDNNQPTIIKTIGGGVVGCLIGGLLYSSDLEEWKFAKFTGKYEAYTSLDITYFNSTFFVLLKKDDEYAIAYTKNLIDFKFYDLQWGVSKPNCIENNGSQMVILCSEGLAERCAIYYTSHGTKQDWARIEVKPPYRSITNSISEMFSAAWGDNQWVFVGRVREWNNSRTMLFSHAAMMLRHEGDLTPESVLVNDNIDSNDLTYVQYINGKFYAYGHSHPNGERCLHTLD